MTVRRLLFALSICALPLTFACGDDDGGGDATPDGNTDAGNVMLPEGGGNAGHCDYLNAFSQGPECKEYTGLAWTPDIAANDCANGPSIGVASGTFAEGPCGEATELGRCVVEGGEPGEYELALIGDDASGCTGARTGCGFGQGEFVPTALCSGDEPPPPASSVPFTPFEESCVEPLAGEEPGARDGEVCTYGAINACTEPGRNYADYGSCDAVFTQRPYYAYEVPNDTAADDPRLSDTEYMEELAWVTEQVEACACVCCHSEATAPDGTSGWFIEADPIWIDTVDNDGLAMLAGWVDSSAFGTFDPEENNGFAREETGLPTTDTTRMKAFLEGELARRGLSRDDTADVPPFGGPLYAQLTYEPEACEAGEGVGLDGTINWPSGGARYIYVLAEGSRSPGVPPNLDTPDGTLLRIDVAPSATPLEPGMTMVALPEGVTQRVPASGVMRLVEGERYALYVLRDVYQPITRCVFTYGE